MKTKLSALLVALFCLISSVMNARTDKVVRILAIGNSFSVDAVEQHLHPIAVAGGKEVIIGNMYIGGCSLKKHLINAKGNNPAYKYRKIGLDGDKVETKDFTLEQALADEPWDYITFQEKSGISGISSSWEKYLPQLLEYVRARVPKKTKMVIHQTWAYDQNSKHKDFKNYNHDQQTMHRSIVDAVSKVSKKTGIKIVIPSGTAIQNARTTALKDVITRDGYHLDKTFGRYIASCTWYEKIFKENVVGNVYLPKGMTPEQRLIAQKSAHEAVRKPCRVTEIR